MAGYTKLFSSILDSTVWDTSPQVRCVWVTLLAMADRDGVVESSVPGLAKRAGVERSHCEQALALFLAPDPDSRTADHGGRRIVVVDGGWQLLNHGKYRDRASTEERREKAAARQQKARDKKRGSHAPSREVTDVTRSNAESLHAEAEAEAEAEADLRARSSRRGGLDQVAGARDDRSTEADQDDDDDDGSEPVQTGPQLSAVRAFGRAIEAAGGIHDGAHAYSRQLRTVERFAIRVGERDGIDPQVVLDGWARRYCTERKSRRADWWLEHVTKWAAETPAASSPAADVETAEQDPNIPDDEAEFLERMRRSGCSSQADQERCWDIDERVHGQSARPKRKATS